MRHERPLSTWEIARLLHVTPVRMLRWIRATKLNACLVPGSHYRVARSEPLQFPSDIPIALPPAAPPERGAPVVDGDAPMHESQAPLPA